MKSKVMHLFLRPRQGPSAVRQLTVWASSVEQGFRSIPLPSSAADQVSHITAGVKSVVAFSPHVSTVWLHPLSDNAGAAAWWSCALHCNYKEDGGGVAMASSGLDHTLILTQSGRIVAVGSNCFGQCGTGPVMGPTGPVKDPVRVAQEVHMSVVETSPVEHVRQTVCGLDHSLLQLDDGSVWSCGWGADGQTGLGSYQSTREVRSVDLSGARASQVFAGADTSFVITEHGEVLAWGNNEYRQLGVDSEEPQVPVPHLVGVSGLDGHVIAVAAGTSFTGFLTEKGSVYVCGYLIERPPDACNEPTVWRELRCVHDGKMFGKKKSLSAGLHYLVALDDGALRGGVVWGKCALPGSSEWNHCGSKFVLGPDVLDVACGPLGPVLLTTTNAAHKLVSVE